MGFSTCSLYFSPRTIHSLYSKEAHQSPTKLPPLPDSSHDLTTPRWWGEQWSPPLCPQPDMAVEWPLFMHLPQFTLATQHPSPEAPTILCVAPELRQRRNPTYLEKWMNPLNHIQFTAHSSNANNIWSYLAVQQKLWILFTYKAIILHHTQMKLYSKLDYLLTGQSSYHCYKSSIS